MRIRDLHITLLLLGGLALVVNTSGWTIQTHLHAHTHAHVDHDGHEHQDEHGHEHQDEHDSDACAVCQHLAELAKQVLVLTPEVLSLGLARYLDWDTALDSVPPPSPFCIGSPRAPPLNVFVIRP